MSLTTTAAEESAGPPIILIVEDQKDALELRAELLDSAGCTTIGVRSSDDAIRELRASPGVDLVLTDIRLGRKKEDKSGVALAEYVKKTYMDVPVAGYSAWFGDSDLSDADTASFDVVWPKGFSTGEQIERIVAACREKAREHRLQRADNAFEAQAVLRRRHESKYPEIAMLRELRLGSGEAAPVETVLGEAGYRLKLVEAKAPALAQPTIVWLCDVDGGIEAEVYGQPALYARAASDDEAIADVIELMHLYGEELTSDAPEAIGPALSLSDFLRRVLPVSRDPAASPDAE
jgi:CheY-like chemotaxis protein